ncbi:MAG: hypothetical protein CO114_05105 [Euryarchaeota archaeon CG_4_9_14_3_um_filter_38_12]|nr:MAG: hypothetical protein CO114_05105 [Euryarchaeota archaeon CG_4_9_14_3_um_filter_38_12]
MMYELNPYAMISLIAILSNLYLGGYILSLNIKDRVNRVFALMMLLFALFAFGSFALLLAADEEAMLFWYKIAVLAMVFVPAAFVHFAMVFPKESSSVLARGKHVFVLYIPSFIFAGLLNTELFIQTVYRAHWGFYSRIGLAFYLYVVYVALFIVYGFYVLLRAYNESSGLRRRQTKWVVVGAATVTLLSLSCDAIPMSWNVIYVPPMTSWAVTIMAALVGYSILKHKLFITLPDFVEKPEYTRLLNKLLSETSKRSFSDFNRYLKETGMGKIASFRDGNIDVHFEKMGSLNLFDVCEKTIEYMEKGYENLSEDFLPVMNSIYSTLNHVSGETDRIFTRIIKKHESFLTKTDIIYGFADGKFLSVIKEELLPKDDADASLKVYRRILLSITEGIKALRADRFRMISAGGEYTRMLSVENGIVSMDNVRRKLRTLPKEAMGSKLRDDFNLLLNIIYKELPEKDAKKMLKNTGFVFKLNKKAAVLGICPNILFEIICNELPVKDEIKTRFPNAEYKNALLRMNAEILSYKELAEKTNMLAPLFGREKVTEISEKYGVGL